MLSGPSAVVSRVPLELSEVEIHQGFLEGVWSLLEPPHQALMNSVQVQRLKRREVSKEDPTKSTWVPRKPVRVIFSAEELRQKVFEFGGIYLF